MNAMLADFSLIWRHAVAPKLLRKTVWCVCALFGFAGGMLAYRAGVNELEPRHTLLLILPWFMLGVLYWLDLVAGAVRQDTPANARLVPRMRVRAMQLVGFAWIVFTTMVTLALADGFGHPALWGAAAAAWLLGAAMVRVGLQYGIALMFLSFMVLLVPRPTILMLQELAATPAGIAACGVWIVLMAWLGKRSLFPDGDRHFDQRTAVEKGIRQTQAGYSVPTRSSLYAAALGRISRKRTSAGELVLHALGPAAHWSVSANMLGVMAVVLVGGRLLIALLSGDSQMLVAFAGGFIVMPMLIAFTASTQRITSRAGASHGEQALLRMAPVVTGTARYNRELASALLRRALIEWALVTLALVAAAVAVNARTELTLLQFAVCCLALPLTTFVLRDYARKPALPMAYVYIAALYLVITAGAAYFAARMSSVAPVALVCIAFGVGATALLAASRRRTMIAAPVAFPAGRMAV